MTRSIGAIQKFQIPKDYLPGEFSGKERSAFIQWSSNMRSYIQNTYGKPTQVIFDTVMKSKELIEYEDLAGMAFSGNWPTDWGDFTQWLYAVLMARTEGQAWRLVSNVQEGNGLEAWRRLNAEYNPKTLNNALALQERLFSLKPCSSTKDIRSKTLEME